MMRDKENGENVRWCYNKKNSRPIGGVCNDNTLKTLIFTQYYDNSKTPICSPYVPQVVSKYRRLNARTEVLAMPYRQSYSQEMGYYTGFYGDLTTNCGFADTLNIKPRFIRNLGT